MAALYLECILSLVLLALIQPRCHGLQNYFRSSEIAIFLLQRLASQSVISSVQSTQMFIIARERKDVRGGSALT